MPFIAARIICRGDGGLSAIGNVGGRFRKTHCGPCPNRLEQVDHLHEVFWCGWLTLVAETWVHQKRASAYRREGTRAARQAKTYLWSGKPPEGVLVKVRELLGNALQEVDFRCEFLVEARKRLPAQVGCTRSRAAVSWALCAAE